MRDGYPNVIVDVWDNAAYKWVRKYPETRCRGNLLYRRSCPEDEYILIGNCNDGAKVDSRCRTPNGWFKASDPRKYYICYNYIPTLATCPHGHVYDGSSCAKSYPCPTYGYHVYEDPDDRYRYYICNNRQATHATCRSDEVFDISRKGCISRLPRPYTFPCPSYGYRLYADPYNARQYYICSNGVPYQQICPHRYVFDENRQACHRRGIIDPIWTVRGECKIEYVRNGHPGYTIVDVWDNDAYKWRRTEIPGRDNTNCCSYNCRQNGKYVNPGNENSYIECYGGQAAIERCPLGGDGMSPMIFDEDRGHCIEAFKCADRFGYYRHYYNETFYYWCRAGVASFHRCPYGQMFDGVDSCVPRFDCPELSGFFKHPSNKTQFYECCYG
ncbi:unnamed protein product, partial [Oppiella nova]